jgi:hypothetical protein
MIRFLLATFFSFSVLSHASQAANIPIDNDPNKGIITSIQVVQSRASAGVQRSTSYNFQFTSLSQQDTINLITILNQFINNLTIVAPGVVPTPHVDPAASVVASPSEMAPALLPRSMGSGVVIPDVAKGYEEVYLQFLRGKLVYKPDLSSDVGKIEWPIAALANPLGTQFDISGCGDSGRYLSISTGYRKDKKVENANKVEIWLAPRLLIERNLATTASHFRGIMGNWNVAVFWTSGDWDDLSWFDYLTTNSFDQLSGNKLYEKCKHHGSRPCFTSRGPCMDDRHRSCFTHYEQLHTSKSSCFMFHYEV